MVVLHFNFTTFLFYSNYSGFEHVKTAKHKAAAAVAAKEAEEQERAQLGLGAPLSHDSGEKCVAWVQEFIKERIEQRPDGTCNFRSGKELTLEQTKAVMGKLKNWVNQKGPSYQNTFKKLINLLRLVSFTLK